MQTNLAQRSDGVIIDPWPSGEALIACDGELRMVTTDLALVRQQIVFAKRALESEMHPPYTRACTPAKRCYSCSCERLWRCTQGKLYDLLEREAWLVRRQRDTCNAMMVACKDRDAAKARAARAALDRARSRVLRVLYRAPQRSRARRSPLRIVKTSAKATADPDPESSPSRRTIGGAL